VAPLANYAVNAAWCVCSVESCVIHAERFGSGVIHLRRYTNGIPLPFTFNDIQSQLYDKQVRAAHNSFLVLTLEPADHLIVMDVTFTTFLQSSWSIGICESEILVRIESRIE